MKGFFQIIKRKKNKRRLTVLWLFLVALELFCPMLDNDPTFAAEPDSPTIVRNYSADHSGLTQVSITVSDNQNQSSEQCFCNDGCLCHGMGLTELPFSINQKTSCYRGERTVFLITGPFFNSLTPPYPPPKIS